MSQISDFVDTLIKAKNAITGTPPASQQTQGMPLTQLPGANPVQVPTQNSNPINDLGNAIAGGINDVAGVVGKVPWVNVGNLDSSGKPITTIGNVYNNIAKNVNANGQTLPQGKITGADLIPMAGMIAGVGEGTTPEEDTGEENLTFGETPTRASYMPPSKFNPPTEVTPTELKINEPESAPAIHGPAAPPPAVGSMVENAGEPFTGENNLPPTQETVKTPVVEPKPNTDKTYPVESVSKDEQLANAKRNITIDGKDVRSPNDVNQINSTLNGYDIKGSATEQLQKSIDTRNELGQKATATITSEGGMTSKADLLDLTTKRLLNTKVQNGLDPLTTEGMLIVI